MGSSAMLGLATTPVVPWRPPPACRSSHGMQSEVRAVSDHDLAPKGYLGKLDSGQLLLE